MDTGADPKVHITKIYTKDDNIYSIEQLKEKVKGKDYAITCISTLNGETACPTQQFILEIFDLRNIVSFDYSKYLVMGDRNYYEDLVTDKSDCIAILNTYTESDGSDMYRDIHKVLDLMADYLEISKFQC